MTSFFFNYSPELLKKIEAARKKYGSYDEIVKEARRRQEEKEKGGG